MRPVALLSPSRCWCGPVQPLTAQATARIIAIGDIHGSIDGFKSHPEGRPASTDANGKWTGGRAQLIQTGDYMDRGEGTRAVLDLLMALEPQAKDAGGRAFALLGNHEVMNLIGETRDVTREIFATFADANSEKRRQQAWEDYAKLAAAKKDKGEPVPAVYAQTREAWLTTHPPGFVEYKEALSPKGKYGAWLRGKPIVTVVDGNIFMHAGIPPATRPRRSTISTRRSRRDPQAGSVPRSADRPQARHARVHAAGNPAGRVGEIGARQRAHRRGARRKARSPIAASSTCRC